jgi:excisionase family DNA binding protein
MTRSLPTLADLVAQPSRVDELTPAQARGLLVEIATLQPLLIARAMAPAEAPAERDDPTRLLTVPDAAGRLGIPESYLYELIRLGRVPAQRIGPKYVRVHPATITDIQERGLDSVLSRPYIPSRERLGAAAATREGNPGGIRDAVGRARQHAGAVRAGRAPDSRDGGAAREASDA